MWSPRSSERFYKCLLQVHVHEKLIKFSNKTGTAISSYIRTRDSVICHISVSAKLKIITAQTKARLTQDLRTLTAVTRKSIIFWDVTPCSLVVLDAVYLVLHYQSIIPRDSSLKLQAIIFPKQLISSTILSRHVTHEKKPITKSDFE
jgi:hypothetical protein